MSVKAAGPRANNRPRESNREPRGLDMTGVRHMIAPADYEELSACDARTYSP
jgi:hypothetical protein